MAVRLTVLGSGSGGNCTYLETDQVRILIDAGFSCRQIRQRLAQIGRAPESLTAILITHEHSDHVQGLSQLGTKLHIPIYCNRATQEALESQFQARFDCRLFTTGAAFEIGDIGVETFSVPHDAQDPVGFFFTAPEVRIGWLTDLGHATKLAIERVRSANVLLLETNHDVRMLQEDPHRPWSVKQRILSRHGHLCNEAAAEVAEQLASAELKHLYLGHLSKECNRPELALRVVGDQLAKAGASHIQLEAACQDLPCPTLVFGTGLGSPQAVALPVMSH